MHEHKPAMELSRLALTPSRRVGVVAALIAVLSASFASATGAGAPPRLAAARIAIDQFGYRPGDEKVAVLSDPVVGFDSQDRYQPGAVLEVREADSGTVAFSAAPQPWSHGALDATSGNRGWWLDFSELSRSGTYYIVDPERGIRSSRFKIAQDAYVGALRAATRALFYNRSGHAKQPPFADPRWSDKASYVGPGQDIEARAVDRKHDPHSARDLRGGWFDAGDTNKYVTFAADPVHQLLAAYRERPSIWPDDWAIPESGNGVPDLLDEVNWELAWLKRMQEPDGGVLIKVGLVADELMAPPSSDRRPRYYGPVCSSSTIGAAGMFAHAAVVFAGVAQLRPEGEELRRRALAAWAWFEGREIRTDCDTQEIKAGDADLDAGRQRGLAVVAAIYLFAATGEARFATYVTENFKSTGPFVDSAWSRYRSSEGEALLYYAQRADSDPEARSAILTKKAREAAAIHDVYGTGLEGDLYRAYMSEPSYHWGSNRVRAQLGNTNHEMIDYGLERGRDTRFHRRAARLLHALHGVNPLGLAYLSSVGELGPERSVTQLFHAWFQGTGSIPAPGFLTGGPNKAYSGPLQPPAGQPPQKSYRDWNGVWPDRSWEVTEPSIGYQAAYIKLVSKFVPDR
jgi:hypothetical protein